MNLSGAIHVRLLAAITALVVGGALVGGCGYSEEEWQAQLDKYNRLVAQNQQTESRLAEVSAQLDAAKKQAADLSKELESMGVGGDRLVSKGYGEARPIVDNATRLNRSKTRRVEFKILRWAESR